MTTISNIDRRLCDYKSNLNFNILKTKVDELDKLSEQGLFDLPKTRTTQKIVEWLSDQVRVNAFTYTEWDWGMKDEEFFFNVKDISYCFDENEIQEFLRLKQKFEIIYKSAMEYKNDLDSECCLFMDGDYDHLIQKFPFELPNEYHGTEQNSLLVLIDRENCYSSEKEKTYSLYIKDCNGKEWKSPFIPIGPRKLSIMAERVSLFSKKIKSDGKVVIKSHDSKLQPEINANILKFIKEGRPSFGYCCIDFVRHVHPQYDKLHYCEFDSEKTISPGDVICLTKEMKGVDNKNLTEFVKNQYAHFALYLGNKLYLSLYGNGGYFGVSSLQRLQDFYFTKDVIVLKINTPQKISEKL